MRNDETRKFFTQRELADHWRISIRTLEGWRYRGIGPTFTKIGNRVLYSRDAVLRFEEKGLMNMGPHHG